MLTCWGDGDITNGFVAAGRMSHQWAPIKMAIDVVMHDFFMFST